MDTIHYGKLVDAEKVAKTLSSKNSNVVYAVCWGEEIIDKNRSNVVKVWKEGDKVESFFLNGHKVNSKRTRTPIKRVHKRK